MSEARWAVFISGRGSNAEALWELLGELNVVLCVSNRKKAYGLLRARRAGIETLWMDSKMPWSQVSAEMKARRVNRVFLLGFMKIVPSEFVDQWQGRMWNLHPSLLPEFPGLEAIEKSFEAGGRMGVTIHEVTAGMDEGPICLQSEICENSKKEFDFESAKLKISQKEQFLVREWARRQNHGVTAWK